MSMQGRSVWITGASSGIGAALAEVLAAEGARLVLSARRADALMAVRERCAGPERHQVLPLDLEAIGAEPAAARAAAAAAGPVDVLVNNAGLSQRSLALDTDLEVDRRLVTINYLGTVALTKAVLPAMVERRAGQVVVVTSLVGKIGSPLRSGYAASKHALHGFFESLRAELHGSGVGVTMVLPGYIRTELPMHALVGDGSAQGRMDRAQLEGMRADVCARKIARAIARRRAEVVIGGREVAGVYVHRLFPALFRWLLPRVRVT